MNRQGVLSQDRLQSASKISPWHARTVKGRPVHTLVRGRFVMQDGKLVQETAGWGRSVKAVQRMPQARPRNTEHAICAVLRAPGDAPRADVAKSPEGNLA